ncbi:MAG: hypothetical protein IKK01_02655 [Clostridia bacterium]|nr:hypothetical protein [Clostridia bacterium]
MKRIIALLLCLIMAVSAVACNSGNTPAETTKAPETQAPATDAPETEAPATDAPETTEAPAPETTAAPETTEAVVVNPIEFADLSAAEQAAIKAVMPVSLPDYSQYEIVTRVMSFDRGTDDYVVQGNSQGSAKFVGEADGAIYGTALKLAACSDKGDSRTEVEVLPLEDVVINDAKGVMFYVDFSNVAPNPEKPMCTSVTINTNTYRAKGPNNGNGDRSAIGYYYMAGTWFETANVNACRMEIPANFAGWVYIPATSFYDGTNKCGLGETFGDIFVMNMRCYTDGYVYSADNYIIFDEIVFIK